MLEPEQLMPSPSSGQPGEDERFRLMADHAPVMLWMSGTDGLCEFFNATWLAFTGRSLEQERGSGWAEGVHPEDFQDWMEAHLQAFVERRAFRIEYRLRRADGAYRWILNHGVPRFAQSGAFEGFIGSCIDITEMREATEAVQARTEELSSALREREVLLGEIHHRVKNNLQLISSMLALQARSAGEETRTALAIGQRRIDVIGLLHEQLYASGNLSSINFGRYIEALLPRLCRTGAAERIAVRQELADVELRPEQAIPSAMILSELVTNALQHAFPEGRQGTLLVKLERLPANAVRLCVSDDGVGLASDFPPQRGASLGLDLVAIFARQLAARVEVERNRGTSFCFTFGEEK